MEGGRERDSAWVTLVDAWVTFVLRKNISILYFVVGAQLWKAECLGARVPGYRGARVQEYLGARVPGYRGARVQECKSTWVQECPGTWVQECKSTWVQECLGTWYPEAILQWSCFICLSFFVFLCLSLSLLDAAFLVFSLGCRSMHVYFFFFCSCRRHTVYD
jgi:hypothetical protein